SLSRSSSPSHFPIDSFTFCVTLLISIPFRFTSPLVPPFHNNPKMKCSLTTVALGALLLSQTAWAGLYSANDHVVDITTQNFQAEVMDSDVRRMQFRRKTLRIFWIDVMSMENFSHVLKYDFTFSIISI